MFTFLEYLEERVQKFLFEMSEISSMPFQDWFDEWNDKFFENKLPRVPIVFRPLKTSTGYASATRNKRTGEITPNNIVLSNYFKRDEEEMKGILLHEMIHLYHFTQGHFLPNRLAHGQHFLDMRKKLQKLVDFDIPLTDVPKETELSDRFKEKMLDVILLKRKDVDNWSVAVYNSGTFLKDMNRFKKDCQGISDRIGNVVEMYHTNVPELFRYPLNKSVFKINTYKLDVSIADKIMRTGSVVWACEPRSFKERFKS